MMAFVAYFAPWFSEQCTMSLRMYHAQCNAYATRLSKQHWALVPSISGHLPLLGQGGGGVTITSITRNATFADVVGQRHCCLGQLRGRTGDILHPDTALWCTVLTHREAKK